MACPKRYDGDPAARTCTAQQAISPRFNFLESPNTFSLEFTMEFSESARYYRYMQNNYYLKVAGMGLQNWRGVMEPSTKKNGSFVLYFEFAGVSLDSSNYTITLFLPEDPMNTSGFFFDIDPKGYNQSPETIGSCESLAFYYEKSKK